MEAFLRALVSMNRMLPTADSFSHCPALPPGVCKRNTKVKMVPQPQEKRGWSFDGKVVVVSFLKPTLLPVDTHVSF